MTPNGLAARGLRVKGLIWEHGEGELVAGEYVIAKTFGVWRAWYLSDPLRAEDNKPIDFQCREAAEVAAEADHASRIAAQLDAIQNDET